MNSFIRKSKRDLEIKKVSTWAACAPEDNRDQRLNLAWVRFVSAVDRAYNKLAARRFVRDTNSNAAAHDCLLNGLITCPLCGAKMLCIEDQQGEQKDVQLWDFAPCRLRCSQSEPAAKSCPMRYFSGAEVERFILQAVEEEINYGQHRRDVLSAYGHTDLFSYSEHQTLLAEVAALDDEEETVAHAFLDAMAADQDAGIADKQDHSHFPKELGRIERCRKEIRAKAEILVKRRPKEALTLLLAERHMTAFFHNPAISDGERNEALTEIIDKIVPHEREGGGWTYEVIFRAAPQPEL